MYAVVNIAKAIFTKCSGVQKTMNDVTLTTHSLCAELIILDRGYRWDGFLRINI